MRRKIQAIRTKRSNVVGRVCYGGNDGFVVETVVCSGKNAFVVETVVCCENSVFLWKELGSAGSLEKFKPFCI